MVSTGTYFIFKVCDTVYWSEATLLLLNNVINLQLWFVSSYGLYYVLCASACLVRLVLMSRYLIKTVSTSWDNYTKG